MTPKPRLKIVGAFGALVIALAAAMPLVGAVESERSAPLITPMQQVADLRNLISVEADPTTGPARAVESVSMTDRLTALVRIVGSADQPPQKMPSLLIWPNPKAILFAWFLRRACDDNVSIGKCVRDLRELFLKLVDLRGEISSEWWARLAAAYTQVVQRVEEQTGHCIDVPRFAGARAMDTPLQCTNRPHQCADDRGADGRRW